MNNPEEKYYSVNGESISEAQYYENWLTLTSAMNLTRAQKGASFPVLELAVITPTVTTLGA